MADLMLGEVPGGDGKGASQHVVAVDAAGSVYTRPGGAIGTVKQYPVTAAAAAYEKQNNVAATKLLAIFVHNKSASDAFLFIVDSAAPIAALAVSTLSVVRIPAGETRGLAFENYPWVFAAGLAFGLSSTDATFTAIGANDAQFTAQYI